MEDAFAEHKEPPEGVVRPGIAAPDAPFEFGEGLSECDDAGALCMQIFAGLGDPLLRLSTVEETARLIKVRRRSLIRLSTQVPCFEAQKTAYSRAARTIACI